MVKPTNTGSINFWILQMAVRVTCLGKHRKRIQFSWGNLYGKMRREKNFKTAYGQMLTSGNGINFVMKSFTILSLPVELLI